MSFSYGFGANPTIDYPRMLIGDTVEAGHIYEDSEINSAYAIQANVWQSSMFYSGSGGRTLPSTPVSYYRVAALLLDSLASNRARLGGVTKLLDVTLSLGAVAKSLHDQANCWRELDDNSGAFVMIEQTNTTFGFLDRFWKQVQRQNAL